MNLFKKGVIHMNKISKEKCVNIALTAISAATKKMAAKSLNEMSMATWYQPKIDADILARIKK